MISERLKECVAMMMIGDGVLAVVEPRGHASLWVNGPPWWRMLVEPFVTRPRLTRCLGAGGVVLGVWLAARQAPALSDH